MLAHIGIYTKDLERLRAFYESYFGMTSNEKYQSKRNLGFESYFLSFGEGTRIELMTLDELAESNDLLANGIHHIAISVGNRKKVDELVLRLRGDGYSIMSEPRVTGDHYYEAVVKDPDGNLIEITE
ncbi:VOC family protein [Lachnoclostridium phytofermentans]|uniref:VOC family protein n=1 Tax=Lachnoclostridium phytofermentans TaxID=66219 RepID=UPI000496B393|nr:VOC family protein [Lachnoclostridium phytofermentans]